jgi:hypothetical protein
MLNISTANVYKNANIPACTHTHTHTHTHTRTPLLTSICKNISRKILRKSLTPVIPALGRLRQEGCEFHLHKLVRVAAFGKGNWVGQRVL